MPGVSARDHKIGSLDAKSSILAENPINPAFSHTREDRSHTREDRSHAREERSHAREERSHAREERSRTREERSRTREDRFRMREDCSHAREDRSRTTEDATFRRFRSPAARRPSGFAELNFPFIRFEDNWKEVKAIWQITQKT
jgi:hypothetical protein